MKIFAVRDETDPGSKDLAYILYFEQARQFYIELPSNADLWETPLLLSSFLKKGEHTINSYWSRLWIQQRILPVNRHNIHQILKNHHISQYDEYALLMLNMGRCAQDAYYLEPLEEKDLPEDIKKRRETKLEDIIPLDEFKLLVFFRNGITKKCSMTSYMQSHTQFKTVLTSSDLFRRVQMQAGGYGVFWEPGLVISDTELYEMGENISVSLSDFEGFVKERVVSSSEAAQQMNCSRQYVDELQKKGRIHPVKQAGRITLYLKNELAKRNWH